MYAWVLYRWLIRRHVVAPCPQIDQRQLGVSHLRTSNTVHQSAHKERNLENKEKIARMAIMKQKSRSSGLINSFKQMVMPSLYKRVGDGQSMTMVSLHSSQISERKKQTGKEKLTRK